MKDYQIIKQIYESANSLVYKAVLTSNNQPVILKILKENYPTPAELARYQQEYEITCSLGVDNVIKALDIQRHENSLVMILEDFGGQSLKSLLSQNKFSLKNFLSIAIKITESLAAIHEANIIHKDINPTNIVYNSQTEQLKIIDFGISSRLSQEFLSVLPPEQLEGTLAYIAPEQTGRMNRGIDYRSDFYSLGVTFYELLTKKLPFQTTDPMELVHCHIAQQPLPVNELILDIPLAISNIINKLLAKTPEDRYQNALGIKHDLETCLSQLKSQGQISPFPLGSQDITEKFQIPQKLYGREQEVTQLLTAFKRVSQGATEMILISGYSGIGKSALVNEIHKPITTRRGQFISGKFDQLHRNIPYSAIAQAFQDLIRKLLREPEGKLQTWKQKILEVLGSNGQIIVDIIPELEKIIGKQPELEPLGRTESQNRFHLFFQRFLSIFCRKEHPLVIFIDDLQWADLSSLNLIEKLISDSDNQYLLIIGAYRDNEVRPTHPLINTLEKINQTHVSVTQITLSPLNIQDINQLIAETLNCSIEVSASLAELVANKTDGNPFFLTQLFSSLYQDNLLVFNPNKSQKLEDSQQGYWQWDVKQIANISITDNVVDLMVGKIAKLKEQTQQILKLAACIGNQFNLAILAVVNNKSQTVTAKSLQPALNEGLIIPLNNNYKVPLLSNIETLSNDISYKFLHDRVQQAAYSLIPESEKKQVHLKIGRLLLNNTQKKNFQDQIFNIVNQLNQSFSLIEYQSEKNELAKLNLQAAKKAKASTAYDVALQYIIIANKLIASNSWEIEYELAIKIYLAMIELFYLNTKFNQVEKLYTIIIRNAKNNQDKILACQFMIQSYLANFKQQKAINTSLDFLKNLGLEISQEQQEIEKHIQKNKKTLQSFLRSKKIEDLASIPSMNDSENLGIILLLQSISGIAIQVNFSLYILIVLIQINLCLKYGNPPQAAIIYGLYSIILCGVMNDINSGYKFGKVSLKLLNKLGTTKLEATVMHLYYGFISHWKKPIRELAQEQQLLDAIQSGIDTGDNEFAGYSAITYCLLVLFGGFPLEDLASIHIKYIDLINKTKQEYSEFYIKICYSIVVNIIHKDTNSLLIGSSKAEENRYLQDWQNSNNEWLLFIFYHAKTVIAYFTNNHDDAYDYALKAEQYLQSVGAYLPASQHNFYSSLALLAYHPECNIHKQDKILKHILSNQEKMKIWTEHCPENFQHKYDLIEAEKLRALEKNWQAAEFYEQAIQGAKKYEFIHEEALAYERAAEFYLALERLEIGQLYLRNAYSCYSRWGAKAKVQQLEKEYPEYLLGISNQSKSSQLSTTISTTGTDGEILDLATILKASQTISGEIKLEKLLQNLMGIVIENAGAQTGFLILNNQDNWAIEAQGSIDIEKITTLQSIPIEYLDPETNISILPTAIINYVARTQEDLVLNNAIEEGQFIDDPYIITKQSKSILCTPLINQGKLSGIVYLENNLTTGAFTTERVELLNILSAQAAISIDNSRLYKNLEQRVAERTKELSQTLDVLKDTQAKLIFENDLLKNDEQASNFDYQVGGSLAMDSPTYVVRAADRNLYKSLKQGEFCYIFNARQMGKSSLMVRMINHLQQEGYRCVAVDMTRIGSENVTPEQWYKGFAVELWRSFGLIRKVKLKNWWQERQDISPVQRLSQFIEEVVLVEIGKEDNATKQNIVIFIDEIDYVLSLKFTVNDFFALIRSCYNQRNFNPDYQRLTFVLLGVATPSDLIGTPQDGSLQDRKVTPFNIGRSIQLEGFKKHEAQPLLQGLTEKVSNPQTMLNELIYWTNGQPFLTQKICQFIRNSSAKIPLNQEAEWIENLVQTKVIDNWESQDEPEHLRTIRDRIIHSDQNVIQLLTMYQQILTQGEISSVDSPQEKELLLSGLIVKQEGTLKVNNRIYAAIFDQVWIDQQIEFL